MPRSEAQKRADKKYKAKAYDDIRLRVLKGNKELLQAYCNDNGLSVNGFINTLIYDKLTEDGYQFITRDEQP